MCSFSSDSLLASASEDCQVKIWDVSQLKKSSSGQLNIHEPLCCLRGHTSPVLTITAPKLQNQSEDLHLNKILLTGGLDGDIRIWNVLESVTKDKYQQTGGKTTQIGLWSDSSKQACWSLDYHHHLPLVLSIKSNSLIQVWDSKSLVEKLKTIDNQST